MTILASVFARTLLHKIEDTKNDNRIDGQDAREIIRHATDIGRFNGIERRAIQALLNTSTGIQPEARLVLQRYLDGDLSLNRSESATSLLEIMPALKKDLEERSGEIQELKDAREFLKSYGAQVKELASGDSDPKLKNLVVESLEQELLKHRLFQELIHHDSDRDLMNDLWELCRGYDVSKQDLHTQEVKDTWKTTYWPMAGKGGVEAGNPMENLWALGGCLDKFDQVLKARGLQTGALDFERTPTLNALAGERSKGHWIGAGKLDEQNAEWTTGVDFDGDGRLSQNIKADFLNRSGVFSPIHNRDAFDIVALIDGAYTKVQKSTIEKDGMKSVVYSTQEGHLLNDKEVESVEFRNPNSDGHCNKTLDVSWWGSCDKVTLAGILFDEPKHDRITFEGVEFTKQDMLGLLTVIAQSQVKDTESYGARYNDEGDRILLKDGTTHKGKLVLSNELSAKYDKHEFLKTLSNLERGGEFVPHAGSEQSDTLIVKNPSVNDFGESLGFILNGSSQEISIKTNDVAAIASEEKTDMNPVELFTKIMSWLSEGKPIAKDSDIGIEVWNSSLTKVGISSIKMLNDTEIEGLNVGQKGHANPKHSTYKYESSFGDFWVQFDENQISNSGWVDSKRAGYDFLWRPKGFRDFKGENPRNPFVKPEIVKEIYDLFMQ